MKQAEREIIGLVVGGFSRDSSSLSGRSATMEPSGIDFGSVYTTIGSALGTPVALVVFWVVSKIKELQTEVKILKKENAGRRL